MTRALFLSVFLLLSACQTKGKINNIMLSFTSVKKVVMNTLPQGMREESTNGRELISGYFNPRKWDEDAAERPERAYAKVLILGAGRPYKIDAYVYRERRQKNGGYANLGEDRKLTQNLVEALSEALADRREDRNIIDDFRAF